MEGLTNIGRIRELLDRHGFRFSKALGQNFIVNPSICPRISEMGGAKGRGVLEIGAGIGVLTHCLALDAQKVVCVEIDKRLLPILDETLSEHENVKIINNDVMDTDLKALIADEFPGMEVAVCANLPYYITSPILMKLLEERLPVESITVMVQKEAATRICAKPGTRQVGAVTLAVQYYSQPHLLFPVSRGSFMPAPNVDSAVIRLDIRKTPCVQVADEGNFFKVVRAAFGQRRKTLHNSLSAGLGIPKANIATAMQTADIATTARAEQLTMEQFAALADSLLEVM